MMSRQPHAVIETSTGRVVDVVGSVEDWAPPAGHHVVPVGDASVGPGHHHDGKRFHRAKPQPPSRVRIAAGVLAIAVIAVLAAELVHELIAADVPPPDPVIIPFHQEPTP